MSVIPKYAILSHTWGKEEVSFQDFQSPTAKCMVGHSKIIGCCDEARAAGLTYVWIDTCCIDKTSSSKLSEAINSMYVWYEIAEVCYAHLADLPGSIDGKASPLASAAFTRSRWFTRGWTLQELLAPSNVVFYSQDWAMIGTKSSLRNEISKITSIPVEVLSKDSRFEASIAMRMSWASKRYTTRIEDMAYSLMGIFGVNMPLLYGEGHNAFARL